MNILTITANKTIAPTVKAILAIEAELAKVQKQIAENAADADKIVTLNSAVEELKDKLAHQGLRRATDDERAAVLKGITNQDTRRALAPTYLNPNACWVEVKKPVEKQVANTNEPQKKTGKKNQKGNANG